jgi:hypothetical protein
MGRGESGDGLTRLSDKPVKRLLGLELYDFIHEHRTKPREEVPVCRSIPPGIKRRIRTLRSRVCPVYRQDRQNFFITSSSGFCLC